MWLESLFESSEINVTWSGALLMIALSFVAGFIISITYMKTSTEGKYSKNFALTMILLPAIISSIILLIGSNVARAFSLAGAFAIIRFRSDPAEPKDIAYVLFAMSAGLALGINEYLYAVLFTIIMCLVMYIISKTTFGNKKQISKQLKITIPEDLNYDSEFDEIFKKYNVSYTLTKVKTTALGSLYQLYYDIVLDIGINTQELLNDLRIRNSNLDISLSIEKE